MRFSPTYIDDDLGRRLGAAYGAAPTRAAADGPRVASELARARFLEEAVRCCYESARESFREGEAAEVAEILRAIQQWQDRLAEHALVTDPPNPVVEFDLGPDYLQVAERLGGGVVSLGQGSGLLDPLAGLSQATDSEHRQDGVGREHE